MGLDMYLNANRYLSSYGENDDKRIIHDINRLVGMNNPDMSVNSVTAEVGYWRKANQIHNWFVQTVQDGTDDCREAYVSRDTLRELKTVCERVVKDNSLASSLLPTTSGFFFGGTEYDQYYFDDVQNTIEIVDRCLALPEHWTFTYSSSW